MTFNAPTHYPDGVAFGSTLKRWQSVGGRWRVELNPVLYGVRLHLVLFDPIVSGDDWTPSWMHGYELVYCLGRERISLLILPHILMAALSRFPECTPPAKIRDAFPEQAVKPIHNDPDCFRRLCELARVPDLADTNLTLAGEIPWASPFEMSDPNNPKAGAM